MLKDEIEKKIHETMIIPRKENEKTLRSSIPKQSNIKR
jgi:hypothetical protein